MSANRTTDSYQRKHPTSRKAILRAVFEYFRRWDAVVAANRLLENPVKTSSLRTWRSRWLSYAGTREP